MAQPQELSFDDLVPKAESSSTLNFDDLTTDLGKPAAAASASGPLSFDDLVPPKKEYNPVGTGAKGFAEGLIPSAAGLAGFAGGMTATGIAIAAVPTPVNAVVGGALAISGGLGTALVAGGGASWVQNKLWSLMDPEGHKAWEEEKRANPRAAMLGGVAAGVAGMSPTTIAQGAVTGSLTKGLITSPAGQRIISGGIDSGMDAATQLITTGKIDPEQVAANAVAGVAMPSLNRVGQGLFRGGDAVANKLLQKFEIDPVARLGEIDARLAILKEEMPKEWKAGTASDDHSKFFAMEKEQTKLLREREKFDPTPTTEPSSQDPNTLSPEAIAANQKAEDAFVAEIKTPLEVKKPDLSYVTAKTAELDKQIAAKEAQLSDTAKMEQAAEVTGMSMDEIKSFHQTKLDALRAERDTLVPKKDVTSNTEPGSSGEPLPPVVEPTPPKTYATRDAQEARIAELEDIAAKGSQDPNAPIAAHKAALAELEYLKANRIPPETPSVPSTPEPIVEGLRPLPVNNPVLLETSAKIRSPDSGLQNIKTTTELGPYIIKQLGPDHYISRILADLIPHLPKDQPVQVLDRAGYEKWFTDQGQVAGDTPAAWSSRAGIAMNKNSGDTLLGAGHELVHAVIGNKIDEIKLLPANHPKKKELQGLVDNVTKLLQDVRSQTSSLKLTANSRSYLDYVLQNENEFMAEGMFAPKIVELLSNIQGKRPSGVLSKLVRYVADFIGIKPGNYTAFEELVRTTSKLAKAKALEGGTQITTIRPKRAPVDSDELTTKPPGSETKGATPPKTKATDFDPRKVENADDLKTKARELLTLKGEPAVREFYRQYQEYKATFGQHQKEAENFVMSRANNLRAEERLTKVNRLKLESMGPKSLRMEVALAIDAKKVSSLSAEGKAIAAKYSAMVKEIGERALKAGVIKGFLENYVTHMVGFKDLPTSATDDILSSVLGRKPIPDERAMSTESRFGKHRSIRTYHDLEVALAEINKRMEMAGSKHQLEVKSLDVAELYAHYSNSMEKAILNKTLFEKVKTVRDVDGAATVRRITEDEPIPQGWKTLDNSLWAGYAIHPDLMPALRFVYETKAPAAIEKTYIVSQAVKRINIIASLFHAKSLIEVLSSTGSWVPLATPLKHIGLAGKDAVTGNTTSGIGQAVKMFKEGGLGDSVDLWLRSGLVGEMPEDVSQGLAKALGKGADELLAKFGPKALNPNKMEQGMDMLMKQTQGRVDKVTWDWLHTGGKFMVAEKYLETARLKAAKEGKFFDESAARKEIVNFVNNGFGGLNWEQVAMQSTTKLGKAIAMSMLNPAGRKGLQILLFAPDWTLSTVRSFVSAMPKSFNPLKWSPKEGVKGMLNPTTATDYARMYQFKTALTYLTLLNGINMMTAGHPIWENRDPTRIEFEDGTSMQGMKHAMEPYHWLLDFDKTLMNKLGFIPKSAIIWGGGMEYASPYADKMVEPTAANRLVAIAKQALPFQASALLGAPEGEGLTRAAAGSLGVPIYGKTQAQRKAANRERYKAMKEVRQKWRRDSRK